MACKYKEMVPNATYDCFYPDADNINNEETQIMCKFCIYFEED